MEDLPIDRVVVAPGALAALLRKHPKVNEVDTRPNAEGIQFIRNNRPRFVFEGRAKEELKGLVELIDNNPMVCADRFSVPDAASTLALIGIGPIALAGLLAEPPTINTNAPIRYSVLNAFMGTVSWTKGVQIHPVPDDDSSSPFTATINAVVASATPDEIRGLYQERFESSFFVGSDSVQRQIQQMDFDDPNASYVLHVSRVNEGCAIKIRVEANREGKCGAAQLVHAMNVMAGFEESLGIGG